MNEQTFRERFPNASKDLVALNCAPSGTEPEQALCDESVGEAEGESQDAVRSVVRVTSFRRRPIDPDNLCPKYFIDSLRYAGAIPDDREQDITLEVNQERVASKNEERTEIEVIYP